MSEHWGSCTYCNGKGRVCILGLTGKTEVMTCMVCEGDGTGKTYVEWQMEEHKKQYPEIDKEKWISNWLEKIKE